MEWENSDIVALILVHVTISPETFVTLGRVCKSWREECHWNERLLMKAAKSQAYLTKRVFMGLFALTPAEADRFPRQQCPRRGGGYMFKYSGAAIDAALVGGAAAWRERLAKRAAKQASIERTFGPDWRETYWIGVTGLKRPLAVV